MRRTVPCPTTIAASVAALAPIPLYHPSKHDRHGISPFYPLWMLAHDIAVHRPISNARQTMEMMTIKVFEFKNSCIISLMIHIYSP